MRWLVVFARTVVTWVVGFVATVVGAVLVLILSLINDTSPLIERVIRAWSRAWLVAAGVRLEVRGAENVDTNRSYMVVANHQSALDIMTTFLAIGLPIRFLAKKELFKVPFLAMGMRAVGIIEVDRAARGAIHSAVNRQAKELIEKKRSVIIFPEGTRPRDGVMQPFKKGAFTMAIGMGLPILPVTVQGTYQAWRPGSPWIRGGRVTVIIDPPIDTSDLTRADGDRLRDQAQQMIARRVDTPPRTGMGQS